MARVLRILRWHHRRREVDTAQRETVTSLEVDMLRDNAYVLDMLAEGKF